MFCCEVESVFNTLLEDEELLQLLFSLLEQEPPLSCKSAGYFGRVVGQLLLRKTNEMMQYLSNNESILEKLVRHVDTTSIADIIKRLVGADDHSSMIFLPMHTQVILASDAAAAVSCACTLRKIHMDMFAGNIMCGMCGQN